MSGTLNNAGAALKTAMVRRLNADMDVNSITGVTQLPIVCQDRPLQSFEEPYIYIYERNSFEIDTTKQIASRKHFMIADVIVRSDASDAATQTRDDIAAEVESIFSVVDTAEYLAPADYNVYIQEVEGITLSVLEEDGATYFRAIIEISFRVTFTGEARTAVPVQQPIYTFDNFTFAPSRAMIELHDSGTIAGATTYSSPNNGWTFDSASYALAPTSQGSIATNVVTIAREDDPIIIDSTLNYTRDTDTTALTAQTTFNRIRSFRFGSVAPLTQGTVPTFEDSTSTGTYGLQDLAQWNSGNRFVRYQTIDPRNIRLTFNATRGNYFYFVYDANQPALQRIVNIAAGIEEDILGNFTVSTIGGYRVYISNRALTFPLAGGDAEYTIRLE